MGCMGGDCASAVTNVCNNEKKVIFAFCKGKLGVRLVGKHPTLQDNSLLGSRTAGLLDIHPLLPRDTQRRWCFSPGGPVVKTSPSNAGGTGSIPGQGPKIPCASQPKNQNIKQKQYCNKLNKDFKNGPHKKFFKKESGILLRR